MYIYHKIINLLKKGVLCIKKKVLFTVIFTMLLVPMKVFAVEDVNGDISLKEGAEVYIQSEEDSQLYNKKMRIIELENQNNILNKEIPTSDSKINLGADYSIRGVVIDPGDDPQLPNTKTISVPVFKQETNYWCGPATTKQVIHYIKGYSSSQGTYANLLNTTNDGTVMSVIDDVLRSKTGKNYIYSSIGSYDSWFYKVKYGINTYMPSVMDINTQNVSSWPYSTSGHYVNTSGYDVNNQSVRITDPYWKGLGNKWYNSHNVYSANNNHWRKAIIW